MATAPLPWLPSPYHGYRPLTEQALARAKADRRVLARHSRDFLDGKHAVEKDKVALEAHAEELEAKVASHCTPHCIPHCTPHSMLLTPPLITHSTPSQVALLHRDGKDRARQQREQQAAYGEQQARANGFERAASEARAKVKTTGSNLNPNPNPKPDPDPNPHPHPD
eukprot:scaffold34997_cov33-Phaeocystis_antarctica.AAC.1